MNIKNNLINFLYDKNYFVTIYEDYIHVFNYLELILLTDNKILLKLEEFNIVIKGKNMFINKLLPNEILIKGKIDNVGFDYV